MANILGINTGQANWAETQRALHDFYQDNHSHYLVTPNPEIILNAQTDEELFYILNQADLSLTDGFGVKIAAKLSGQNLTRITGADLLPYLLKEADEKQRRLTIINRRDGLSSAEDIATYLKNKYPHLKYQIIDSPRQNQPSAIDLAAINNFRPNLLICLLGSPEQEKYLFHVRLNIRNISISAGLGGAFDFLTGKIQRAPLAFRNMGLEWLWRLFQQPRRWRRIWRATAIFSAKIIYWLYIMPQIYRPNVAVLMYRKTPQGREIFIVERQGQPGHWQIPQGGTDNLDIVSAGCKELREESGAQNFKIINSYKNLYQYKFNKENGKYNNPENKRHFGYKGQRQSLLITEFLGHDSELKINYWDHSAWRWIKEKDFIKTLHASRREAATIYLQKLYHS